MATDYTELSKELGALGHPTRLRLLALLQAADEQLCVCELSDGLAIPNYQTSRHLKVLSEAGWVSRTREGLWIYYELSEESRVIDLPSLLEPVAEDLERMKRRLRQRKDGRCVIGPTKRSGDRA